MKTPLLGSALIVLLLATASCSSGDKALEHPTRFGNTSTKRSNDKSRSLNNRDRNRIGLGLDLHANDPQKFHKVDAPKKYKYKKAR